MAKAIVITLERDVPGEASAAYVKAAGGKALARESDRLDHAARVRKVPAITSMLSESPAALIEQMRESGMDPSRMRLPPEQWFDAAQGAATLGALAEHVTEKLNDFKQPNPILRDLKSAEALLTAASTAGVRFHFTKTDL